MLENFLEEYKVFALPYLFKDEGHRWRVLKGEVGKRVLASGEKIKLKGLVYYDAGARSSYTVDKAILHPDELKGLKIRTQQSPMAMKMVEALGGSATPISWGELYTSLQQGVVDGAENNPPSLFTSNHFEVSKHYSLDEHTSVPDIVVINTLTWNKLSDEHKKALTEAAEESVEYQRQLWKAFVREMVVSGVTSIKRNYGKGTSFAFKEAVVKFFAALPPLLLVVLVLGGILGGLFTATEASAIAVLYAFFLSVVAYREVKIREIPEILLQCGITTAVVMLLIGCSMAMSWGRWHSRTSRKTLVQRCYV